MSTMTYLYPAKFQPDEAGRWVVSFPDLPEALTDGADLVEALRDAPDCLSEALASRIVDGEDIPAPSVLIDDHLSIFLISPDPTIALKAALYMRLRESDWTLADLARSLDIDWHQAARLIDPKRPSKLKTLQDALAALGRTIIVAISDGGDSKDGPQGSLGRRSLASVFSTPGEEDADAGPNHLVPVPVKSST